MFATTFSSGTGFMKPIVANATSSPMTENKHRVYTGVPGGGKSYGLVYDLKKALKVMPEFMKDVRPAMVFCDLHGSSAMDILEHCHTDMFLAQRIIYEQLLNTERHLSWGFAPSATVGNPDDREIENRKTVKGLTQALINRRNADSISGNPLTEEGTELILSVLLGHPAPFYMAEHLFNPGTREYHWMMDHSPNPEAVARLRQKENLSERDYEFQMGPARRLFNGTCKSRVLQLRTGEKFDWKAELEARKLVIIDGSGVDVDDYMITITSILIIVAATAKNYFEKHHKPLPIIVVLEELINSRLLTPWLIHLLFESRKHGVMVWGVIQNVPPQPMRGDMMTGFGDHVHHRAGDSETAAAVAADMIGDMSIHEEHHTTKRVIQDGTEEQKSKTKGKTTGHDGEERVSESETVSHRPTYREEEDTHYKTPQQMLFERQSMVMNLKVGERIVKDKDGVRKELVPKMPEPIPGNIHRVRTREIIKKLHQQELYTPPTPWKLNSPPPNTPPASEPAPIPIPPTPKAGPGMRRS